MTVGSSAASVSRVLTTEEVLAQRRADWIRAYCATDYLSNSETGNCLCSQIRPFSGQEQGQHRGPRISRSWTFAPREMLPVPPSRLLRLTELAARQKSSFVWRDESTFCRKQERPEQPLKVARQAQAVRLGALQASAIFSISTTCRAYPLPQRNTPAPGQEILGWALPLIPGRDTLGSQDRV